MRKLLLLLIVGVGLFSCDNSDDQMQSSSSGKIVPVLERFIHLGEENSRASYLFDGSEKLKSIIPSFYHNNNENDYIKYEYNSDYLISKITQRIENYEWQKEFEYNSEQKLIKETSTVGSNTIMYLYNYEADGNIEYQYLQNGVIYRNGTIRLNGNGEIIELRDYDLNDVLVYSEEISYDDKNSPYKNIQGVNKLIFGMTTLSGSYGRVNNVLQVKKTYYHGSTFSEYFDSSTYTYNKDNFPVTCSQIFHGYSTEGFIHFTYR